MGGKNSTTKKIIRKDKILRPIWKDALAELKKFYVIGDTPLGKGAFGRVFKGCSITDKNFQVAIKLMNKTKMRKKDIKELHEEVMVLNQLDHRNIVKYYEIFEDKKSLYIVMEYCSGSNLYDRLTSQDLKYSETEAAKLAQELLLAVFHCHSSGITHRDIKLENIMITEDKSVKLIDFGLSKNATTEELMLSMTGTPYYMAPEVFDYSKYGSEVDIWSLGVVFFTVLGGYRPFTGDNLKEIVKNIKECNYKFHTKEWGRISRDAKDLISMMLTLSPKKRITAEKALRHPWFGLITEIKIESTIKQERKLDKSVLKRIENYKHGSFLKKWCLNLLLNMLSPDEKHKLEVEFEKFDENKTGLITEDEFVANLKENNANLSNKDIKKIQKEITMADNSLVNYTDLLTAIMDIKKLLTKDRLKTIFAKFNSKKKNKIYEEDIINGLEAWGYKVSESDAEEFLQLYDTSGKGYMNQADFKAMLVE